MALRQKGRFTTEDTQVTEEFSGMAHFEVNHTHSTNPKSSSRHGRRSAGIRSQAGDCLE
jgi:hypothetical protein